MRVWNRYPEEAYAFVVRIEMVAWQEVYFIVANPEGLLRMLSLGGPSLFGCRSYEVPLVSYDYFADAVD